jgi:hypothetical protein
VHNFTISRVDIRQRAFPSIASRPCGTRAPTPAATADAKIERAIVAQVGLGANLPEDGRYFTYAAELLKVNPPHITDEPMIAQLKKIGIEPGKSFDLEKAHPAIRTLACRFRYS